MKRITAIIFSLAVTFTIADRALAQNGRELFQQAVVKERADGDFRGAITIYERIVRDFASDRSLAANALVQLGECYEKLGSSEAEQAYQRVLSEYSDQGEFVTRARTRLAALHPVIAETSVRGPVARRLFSGEDTDINDFSDMVPSPDERRVAYTRLGSDGALMVRDLAMNDPVMLAPGMPEVWNNDPEWSPDGRRIAYGSSNRKTYAGFVKIVDVASRRETDSFPFTGWVAPLEWSHDGRLLLVRHHAGSATTDASLELLSIADGSTKTLADTIAGFSAASFSPDGQFVAFAAPSGGRTQIFLRPLSGGERRQLTDETGGDSPRFSPDGRFIAFTRDDAIWVVPVAGGAASGDARQAYIRDGAYVQAWYNSGLYLTVYGGRSVAYQVPVEARTGSVGREGATPLPDPVRETAMFAWSPDMKQIAFVGEGGTIDIYSTDRQTVTRYETGHAGGVWDVWWSADGRNVVWEPDVREWPGILLTLDPTSGRIDEPFAPVNGASVITLSPNGSMVAYKRMAADSSGTELVVAPAGRTDAAVVVAAAFDPGAGQVSPWVRPRFSPRGDRVLFGRSRNIGDPNTGPWEGSLWVVANDGSGTRRLGTIPHIRYATWDPTGRFIAYTGLDADTPVLRIVEVATGAEHTVPVPPNLRADIFRVTDWSHDGRFIGFTAGEARWEYWLVRGLENTEL